MIISAEYAVALMSSASLLLAIVPKSAFVKQIRNQRHIDCSKEREFKVDNASGVSLDDIATEQASSRAWVPSERVSSRIAPDNNEMLR